ncbi:MAG TPA: permease-like cell division protein FtsX [Acidimicrobiales bacterium]|nr:permease-like cell division protein FtsX [Acidimicrobiales bacterium]
MPVSFAYVAKETTSNLLRNLLMTVAAVLTVAVSLWLVGGALLLKQGVTRATIQWKGGVELSIFLKPEVEQNQIDAVRRELGNMPEVKRVKFVDQDAAFEEFKQIVNVKDYNDVVTAKDLPPSFRVVPTKAELVETIGERFRAQPGVSEVVYAKDTINRLLSVTRKRQIAFFGLAAVVLVSATVLILNTIQLAIFARRREVAVMKLVGATNWFIRLPFMLEGMAQGLVGAAVAFIGVYVLRNVVMDLITDPSFAPVESLAARATDAVGTGMFLLVVGAFVGAIGSAIAVRRFLDV